MFFSSTSARSQSGFTLIEALVVIAVLGILMGIGVPMLRPSGARLAANSLLSTIQQAKFDSIKTNRPMVISFDAISGTIAVRRGNAAGTIDCGAEATAAVRTVSLADYGSRIQSTSSNQFVWLPNGQPRACAGGWLGEPVVIALAQGDRTATVSVSPGGEVAVQ